MTDRALTEADLDTLFEAGAQNFGIPNRARLERLLAEHAALLAVARAAERVNRQDVVEDDDLLVLDTALAALPPGLLTTENGDAR